MVTPVNYSARIQFFAGLIVVASITATWLLKGKPILDGISLFLGPDSYMRVARVEWWMANGRWYDSLFPLSNAPQGELLHWTRPLDVLLVLGVKLLSLVMDAKSAMVIWGAMVSPVFLALAVMVMGIAMRPVLSTGGFLLFAALLALQPVTNSYAMVARPDHHALLLFLFAAMLAMSMRVVMEPDRHRMAGYAGLSGALGVWVAVESLLGVAVALLVLGLAWMKDGDRRLGRAMFTFCLILLVGLTLALVVERPPAEWVRVEHDRLSVSHWTLSLLLMIASGFLLVMGRHGTQGGAKRRLILAGLASLFVVGTILVLFPTFVSGPMAALDPRLKPIWFDIIKELQPYFPTNRVKLGEFFMILGPTLTGGAGMIWWLRRGEEVQRIFAFSMIIALSIFALLTVYQARWAMYLGFLSAVPWAILLVQIWKVGPALRIGAQGHVRLRAPVFLGLMFWHLGLWAMLSAGQRQADAAWDPRFPGAGQCQGQKIPDIALRAEAERAGHRITVMADIDLGPEIIYFSDQKVISGPYHRNTQGILDVHDFFAATDPEAARLILERRKVDVVLVCGVSEDQRDMAIQSPHLGAHLEGNKPPDWLIAVDSIWPSEGGYRLYRYRGAAN